MTKVDRRRLSEQLSSRRWQSGSQAPPSGGGFANFTVIPACKCGFSAFQVCPRWLAGVGLEDGAAHLVAALFEKEVQDV